MILKKISLPIKNCTKAGSAVFKISNDKQTELQEF